MHEPDGREGGPPFVGRVQKMKTEDEKLPVLDALQSLSGVVPVFAWGVAHSRGGR